MAESKSSPDTPAPEPPPCLCGKPFSGASDEVRIEVELKEGKKALLHELCFLRVEYTRLKAEAAKGEKVGLLLGGLVLRLGGSALLQMQDIERAKACGGFTSHQEGTFIGLKVNIPPSIVVAQEMPKGPIRPG